MFARHGFEAHSQRFADREQRETYALVAGSGSCPKVLVHGGLAEAGVWTALAGRLSGRVVVPDRPGCGLTYPIDYLGVDYRADAARWLLDLVDGLGADQIDLIGNSMGGYFSMAFALAHPGRVRNLILIGAPAGLDRQLPLFIKLLGARGIGPFLSRKLAMDDPELLRKRVFTGLVAHPERVPTEVLEVALLNAALPSSQRCAHTMLRQVATWSGFRPSLMLRSDMETLDIRTLFLWGDRDSFAPPSSGRQLAARMPRAELRELEDTGHMPQLEVPERVAEHIEQFCADQPIQHANA